MQIVINCPILGPENYLTNHLYTTLQKNSALAYSSLRLDDISNLTRQTGVNSIANFKPEGFSCLGSNLENKTLFTTWVIGILKHG